MLLLRSISRLCETVIQEMFHRKFVRSVGPSSRRRFTIFYNHRETCSRDVKVFLDCLGIEPVAVHFHRGLGGRAGAAKWFKDQPPSCECFPIRCRIRSSGFSC